MERLFEETEPESARPTDMVRLTRTTEWILLLVAVLCAPLQNAAGQDSAQPQNPLPHQNHPPRTQPNQAQPVMRAEASTPAQPTTVPAGATQSTPVTKSRAQKKQKAPEQTVAESPAAPPTLEQVPPTPPTVTYRNGQLSIQAQNSTLSQVLRAVQAQTGASVDLPGGASGERVVAQLGPGQPRDVLATLLNGSHFNYVILGTPGNSGGVQKVILTARQGSSPSPSPGNPVTSANQPPPAQDDDTPADDDGSANDVDNDATQNGQAVTPGRPGIPGQEQQPDNNDQGQNGPKTPEQLLQELQRMQQQQQQYQQQLNPANQQPAPNQPQ